MWRGAVSLLIARRTPTTPRNAHRVIAQDAPFHTPAPVFGPLHGLWKVRRLEGSLTSLLLRPRMLLLPALVHGLVPVLEATCAWCVSGYLGVDVQAAPLLAAGCHAVLLALHALVLTPLEHLQRRTHLHGRARLPLWQELRALTQPPPPPTRRMGGPKVALRRISPSPPQHRHATPQPSVAAAPADTPHLAPRPTAWQRVRHVYRGFWPRYYALLIRAAFHAATAPGEEEEEWW
jgi:hypothetical protein